jgi:hypothetical protein
MNEKKTEKNRKKPKTKYVCLPCNFFSDDKRGYIKHLETKKHKKKKPKTYICIFCDKSYNYASGLSKHKKKCLILKKNIQQISKNKENSENKIISKKNEIILKKNEIISKKNEIISKKNEKQDLLKENNDLKNMLKELMSTQKELMSTQKELINTTTKNNITTNTINNIYNKMSVNIYLNEKCKNAMNLTDFVNQINISLDDLEYTKDNGFAKGIANILKKQLQDLNPTERPIHCSDKKRLQFYVKDEGKWGKDSDHKKIDKSIQDVQKAQIQKMVEWEKNHPGWKNKPQLVDEWSKIVHGLTGSGVNEEKSKKEIKRNLSAHIDVKNEILNK